MTDRTARGLELAIAWISGIAAVLFTVILIANLAAHV